MNFTSLNDDCILLILKLFPLPEQLPFRLVGVRLNEVICKNLNNSGRLKLPSTIEHYCYQNQPNINSHLCLKPSPKLFSRLTSLELDYCKVELDQFEKGNEPFQYYRDFLRHLETPEQLTRLVVNNFRLNLVIDKRDFWELLANSYSDLQNLSFNNPFSSLLCLPPSNNPVDLFSPSTSTISNNPKISTAEFQATVFARLNESFLINNLSIEDHLLPVLLLLSPHLKKLHISANLSSLRRVNPQLHLNSNKLIEVDKELQFVFGYQKSIRETLRPNAAKCSSNKLAKMKNVPIFEEMTPYEIFAILSRFSQLHSLTLHLNAYSLHASMLNLRLCPLKHNPFSLNSLVSLNLHLELDAIQFNSIQQKNKLKRDFVEKIGNENKIYKYPFNLNFFREFISSVCPNLKEEKIKITVKNTKTIYEKK